MAKQPASLLELPPFPPLKWDLYFWEGEVVLKSWAGYRLGRKKPSSGAARVSISPPGEVERATPSPEQAVAFRHLLAEEKLIHDTVLHAIFDYYPGEAIYNEEDEPPPIRRPQQLRTKISLSEVHVLDVVRDGAAYVGLQFRCTWDQEHGCGVMLHLDHVVATGQADTSFHAGIARRDVDRPRE
jgi:hypothetical protein